MSNVEVLVIGEAAGLDGERCACGFVNLALFDTPPEASSELLSFEEGQYVKVGKVTRAFFDDLEALDELLADPVVLDAARRLAVGLLRKGGGMFARFHDFNLADDLFAAIEASMSANPDA